jgi:hypothetical protein
MKTPVGIIKDLEGVLAMLSTDPKPIWHSAAATMLNDIASRIREEVASQPSPDFPPVE